MSNGDVSKTQYPPIARYYMTFGGKSIVEVWWALVRKLSTSGIVVNSRLKTTVFDLQVISPWIMPFHRFIKLPT